MRYFLSLFILLLSTLTIAQEAAKFPLLEHFTNTRCPICASRNPSFHDLRQSFGDQVNHIAFHPKYPYSTCVFYQANKEGNQSRADHYNISGTPTVYLDGNEGQGSQLVSRSAIEAAVQELSFFEIDLEEFINGDQVAVDVTITTRGEVPDGNTYRLYVATVESPIAYNAPNGENMHYNVFRTFSTQRNGVPITVPANGASEQYSFQYTVMDNWEQDHLYSVAFIENDQQKSIENSARSSGILSSLSDHTSGGMTIYPNPVSDDIYFTEPVQEVRLFDITGRQFDQRRGSAIYSLDLSHLSNGIYFLSYRQADKDWIVERILIEN